MEIKALEVIKKKWARVTPGRSEDYATGVKTPRRDWEGAASAAESAYEAGVTEAIGDKRFGAGVRKAGTAKWQTKASTIGVDRWGGGVRAAEADYGAGFAPYQAALGALDLPPRGPKGDPKNIERVATIARTLHDVKAKGAA